MLVRSHCNYPESNLVWIFFLSFGEKNWYTWTRFFRHQHFGFTPDPKRWQFKQHRIQEHYWVPTADIYWQTGEEKLETPWILESDKRLTFQMNFSEWRLLRESIEQWWIQCPQGRQLIFYKSKVVSKATSWRDEKQRTCWAKKPFSPNSESLFDMDIVFRNHPKPYCGHCLARAPPPLSHQGNGSPPLFFSFELTGWTAVMIDCQMH